MDAPEQTENHPAAARLKALFAGRVRSIAIFSAAQRAGRIAAGLGLAGLAGGMVLEDRFSVLALLVTVTGILTAFICGHMAERRQAFAEVDAAREVTGWFERAFIRGRVRHLEALDAGDQSSRFVRYPAAAAGAVVTVTVARMMAGIGAVLALGVMAFFSWQAALLMALTLPVMIVFFVFVGGMTARHAARQEAALQKLSGSFADRVRCLPTIIASHVVGREADRLEADLEAHRQKAGALLRVAFLNAGVLDFFSSLSIAMLAIFLGLGHLGLAQVPGFSNLSLTASLSILILAPEVFQPLRRFAELYHKAAEGKAALTALDDLLAIEPMADPRLPSGSLSVRNVILQNGLLVPDLDMPARGLIAVHGPSGCGKTSLLRVLAGVDAPDAGHVFRPRGGASWIAADGYVPAGSVARNFGGVSVDRLTALALEHDPRFSHLAVWEEGGGDLSGGQRLRIALATAMDSGSAIIFADEPTAKLDPRIAARVRQAILILSETRLVVVATHDASLIDVATETIDFRQEQISTEIMP